MPRRALIVDDEPGTCGFIQDFLLSNGIESLSLTESGAAVGHLWAEKCSIILLDLRMASPDGVMLASWIRRSGINQHTPIAMISDDHEPASLSRSFDAGANFLLYKPVDEARLVRLINAARAHVEYEKRRFQRVPSRSKARLTFELMHLDGETIDVSLSGLLVEADRIVPPGARAKIALHIEPEVSPIVGSGSIVRIVGKNQMGVKLDRLNSSDGKRLEEFLRPVAPHEWPETFGPKT